MLTVSGKLYCSTLRDHEAVPVSEIQRSLNAAGELVSAWEIHALLDVDPTFQEVSQCGDGAAGSSPICCIRLRREGRGDYMAVPC